MFYPILSYQYFLYPQTNLSSIPQNPIKIFIFSKDVRHISLETFASKLLFSAFK